MSTSRAERSRLAPLIAINQHIYFDFGRFPDFHRFCCTPPFKNPTKSGNRWNQKKKLHFRWKSEIQKVTTKFSVERPWLTASIAMKECPTETFLKCVSVATNRDIFQVRGLVRTPQSKRVYARCYRSENCGKHFSNHILKCSSICSSP